MKSPRRHRNPEYLRTFSVQIFLMLIILQIFFVLFLVSQSILFQAQNLNVPLQSHAGKLFDSYDRYTTVIGSTQYVLYDANSPEKQIQGLSGVQELFPFEGMIFRYETPGSLSFWMKDMLIPLDFVFTNSGVVVDLKENVSPDTYPSIIKPQSDADAVIELNAGEIKKNGIKVGDMIDL